MGAVKFAMIQSEAWKCFGFSRYCVFGKGKSFGRDLIVNYFCRKERLCSNLRVLNSLLLGFCF